MLENFQGDSWGLILPLRMPSLLPHDLCQGRSSLPARYVSVSVCRAWGGQGQLPSGHRKLEAAGVTMEKGDNSIKMIRFDVCRLMSQAPHVNCEEAPGPCADKHCQSTNNPSHPGLLQIWLVFVMRTPWCLGWIFSFLDLACSRTT